MENKYYTEIAVIVLFLLNISLTAGTKENIVTDYDGNVYNTIEVGQQTWLKENLKSLHYSDGTSIPDVVAYNDDDSLANIYGRLYSWNAAMNNSTEEGAQGVCPCGWHVPSDTEWLELENYLGGAAIAGGKMKESGTAHWKSPNTGADNSSGFTALPAGEYDAYYNPNSFQLFKEYAVFWTSTEVSTTKARERYLAYNNSASSIYDWYKVMKYSIRCIKDAVSTGKEDNINLIPSSIKLYQNFPNPFNPQTKIEYFLPASNEIIFSVYNSLGQKVRNLFSGKQSSGYHEVILRGDNLPSGIYYYSLKSEKINLIKKCLLIK